MNSHTTISLAFAAVAATFTLAGPVTAGDLGDGYRGSLKDAPMVQNYAGVGRCYVRGDVGYSYSTDSDMTLSSPNYGPVETSDADVTDAWMGEIGVGCGSGSRGLRADFTLGYRSEREIDGFKPNQPGIHFPAHFTSKVSTLTAMANLYYDFGQVRGFVPYVGVGFGVARHDSDATFDFSGQPATNQYETIGGSTTTNFAWSVMAGAAYQISERAVLDVGYRYMDMGEVTTRGNICDTCIPGGSQETLKIDDINAHEFKIGLRYHFGGGHARAWK